MPNQVIDARRIPYVMIHKSVVRLIPEIGMQSFALYVALESCKTLATPSIADLAIMLHTSTLSICRGLACLKRHGLLDEEVEHDLSQTP